MKTGSTLDYGWLKDNKAEDATARHIWHIFRAAENYRNALPCGSSTLAQEFVACERQFHGRDADKYRAANGDIVYVNFSATKISVVLAFLNKVGFDESGVPFKIEPSPLPDLNDDLIRTITNKAITNLVALPEQLTFGLASPETLLQRLNSDDEAERHIATKEAAAARDLLREYVEAVRYEFQEEKKAQAREKAANMLELMTDQLKEGSFNEALAQFREDVLVYPYAAVEGPLATAIRVPKWKGTDIHNEVKVEPRFRTVRPWDVVWSADSTSTQDGTYTMVRKYYSRDDLIKLLSLGNEQYITAAVKDILDMLALMEDIDVSNGYIKYLNTNGSMVPHEIYKVPLGGAITGVTYYGKLSGAMLLRLGYTSDNKRGQLESYQLYETEMTVIAGRVVRAVIYHADHAGMRPINTVSIKGKTYGMYGESYIGTFRHLERAYNSKMVWEHTNDYATSADLLEIDVTRLSVEDTKAIAERQKQGSTVPIKPGTVISASTESLTGASQARVVQPHKLADVHPNRRMGLAAISAEIDRVSGVPASMHGEASSSGMMRSFKTVFLLEGNASSILTNMAAEIDKDLYAPIAKSLNIYNLLHVDDPSIKGDVNIIAGGVKGAVEKEVEAERTKEDGMVIVQAMGMVQHISSPELRAMTEAYVTLGLEELLHTTGVDQTKADKLAKALLAQMYEREEQQQMMEQQAMQQQAAPQQVEQVPQAQVAEELPPQVQQEGPEAPVI